MWTQSYSRNHIWLEEALFLASTTLLPSRRGVWSAVALVPAVPSSLDDWPVRWLAWSQRLLYQELWGSRDLSFCLGPKGRFSWRCPFSFQHIWEEGYIFGMSWLLAMLLTYLEAYRPSSCCRLYPITQTKPRATINISPNLSQLATFSICMKRWLIGLCIGPDARQKANKISVFVPLTARVYTKDIRFSCSVWRKTF